MSDMFQGDPSVSAGRNRLATTALGAKKHLGKSVEVLGFAFADEGHDYNPGCRVLRIPCKSNHDQETCLLFFSSFRF
jgi:hypothetical protein